MCWAVNVHLSVLSCVLAQRGELPSVLCSMFSFNIQSPILSHSVTKGNNYIIFRECDDWKRNISHRYMNVNTWFLVGGTVLGGWRIFTRWSMAGGNKSFQYTNYKTYLFVHVINKRNKHEMMECCFELLNVELLHVLFGNEVYYTSNM